MKKEVNAIYSQNLFNRACLLLLKEVCFLTDINECQLQGVCPNGECLNTMGSYRCTCKIGFGPDPTFSSCVRK